MKWTETRPEFCAGLHSAILGHSVQAQPLRTGLLVWMPLAPLSLLRGLVLSLPGCPQPNLSTNLRRPPPPPPLSSFHTLFPPPLPARRVIYKRANPFGESDENFQLTACEKTECAAAVSRRFLASVVSQGNLIPLQFAPQTFHFAVRRQKCQAGLVCVRASLCVFGGGGGG